MVSPLFSTSLLTRYIPEVDPSTIMTSPSLTSAAALAASGLQTIVYISCSPPDLMRDLKVLTQNYTIAEAVFFDMFPQTSKIETGILLKRK